MDYSKVYFSISKIFEKAMLFIYLFVHNFQTKQNTKGIMKIIRMVFHNYVFETFENSGSKSKTDFIASISMSKEKNNSIVEVMNTCSILYQQIKGTTQFLQSEKVSR